MKIQYLASSVGAASPHHFLTSFLVNDTIAIDAGGIGLMSPPEKQKQIKAVVLSHSHVDHIASLPIFLDNVYNPKDDCVTVYASDDVQDCLRRDVFNDRVWPDLIRMSDGGAPFVAFETIIDGNAFQIGDVLITTLSVDHVVPCYAFLIEEQAAAVAIVTDTGPTEQVWKAVNACQNLKAVFLEASFPNSFQWLADKSKHLTPAQFAAESEKISCDVPLIAIHLKPNFHDEIVSELTSLNLPQLLIAEPDKLYEF